MDGIESAGRCAFNAARPARVAVDIINNRQWKRKKQLKRSELRCQNVVCLSRGCIA